ncbi:pyrroline-5-carboxylate reductase [Spirochaetota bacterium]|nr:pyrroline-5-carboxylate reductase [Spirochaetota bacterium]
MKTCVCGYGVMGSAIAKTLLTPSLAKQLAITTPYVYEPNTETSEIAAKDGFTVTKSLPQADLYFLCMKPQDITPFFTQCGNDIAAQPTNNKPFFISIAAGVNLTTLSSMLTTYAHLPPAKQKCARIMPNLPTIIQAGAGAVTYNSQITPADKKIIHSLLSTMGTYIEIAEHHMDAVTALSGSSPAFILTAIEAVTDAGVLLGLSKKEARTLAAATFKGTAELVLNKHSHPAVLRDQVTSPAGTTIYGLRALEQSTSFRSALMNAIRAAYKRSRTLGKQAARRSAGKQAARRSAEK